MLELLVARTHGRTVHSGFIGVRVVLVENAEASRSRNADRHHLLVVVGHVLELRSE